jgi:hypothetical protein
VTGSLTTAENYWPTRKHALALTVVSIAHRSEQGWYWPLALVMPGDALIP